MIVNVQGVEWFLVKRRMKTSFGFVVTCDEWLCFKCHTFSMKEDLPEQFFCSKCI